MPKYMVAFRQISTVCKVIDSDCDEGALKIAGELMDSDYGYDIIAEFCQVMEWEYSQDVVCMLDDDCECEGEYITPETIAEYIGE